jgi:hypothetical protein
MIRPIQTRIHKQKIIQTFKSLPTTTHRRADLDKLLAEHRKEWGLSRDTTVDGVIKYLAKSTQLKEARFKFPSRNEIRYTWGEVPVMEVVFSLRPQSYFSHFTAMSLHGLTDQIPKAIYLNTEQRPKLFEPSALEQKNIDLAFRNAQRQTTMCAEYSGFKVFLLNGMHTGQLGVIDFVGSQGEKIRVTDIERTLIDAAVRPVYAGGVFEVLKAFKSTEGRASLNKVAATLKKLNYIYPYHQVIGFYAERSGAFSKSAVEILKQFDIKYDFYLAHQMKETEYSPSWHLYFPKGF